jgi:hypothetical protein
MARERTYSGKVLGGDRSDRPRPVNHCPVPKSKVSRRFFPGQNYFSKKEKNLKEVNYAF